MQAIVRFSGKYFFLSNHAPCEIHFCLVDGSEVVAPTVEHAFQASKTIVLSEQQRVLKCSQPGCVIRVGREVQLRPDWEQVKDDIMRRLLCEKFTRCPHLRQALLETGDAILLQGNTWGDQYWGVVWTGLAYEGENRLGQLLMELRKQIGEGECDHYLC